MKITYKTNVLDIIRLVENNTPALWEKEHNNFPNTWGGVNALTKQVVKDLLVMINLPYSKELAGFIRYIVECPNIIRYSEYKRSLIGKTVEDVIFESEQKAQYISLSVKIVICLFKIKDIKIPYTLIANLRVLAKCGSRFCFMYHGL